MRIKYVIKKIIPYIYIYRLQTIWKKIALCIWNDEQYIKRRYKKIVGRNINFQNPTTFSEKLQVMKLHNRNPLLTKCTDKLQVREYVISRGLSEILVPIISVLDNSSEIDLSILPNEFFLKCNHASGTNLYVKDKTTMKEKQIKKTFKIYMSRNHYVMEREWNYKNIVPKIIVEKPIKDSKGNLPFDYKFMCFNGIPKIVMVCTGIINESGSKGNPECNFYDIDFNLLDLRINNNNIKNRTITKPKNFDKMVEISRKLSSEFTFCRVDLFSVDNQVFFGELTFIHGSGLLHFEPREYDYLFGQWLGTRQGDVQ
ncbi:MAG: ATP-grasp fold amidoligase family protein [Candidatus Izemoplasma sp.]|nr:ATP-grasp fold amidoligase family protein [Candidatus Izemoplasma sp.]